MKNDENTPAGSKYTPELKDHIEEFLLEQGREADSNRKRWNQ